MLQLSSYSKSFIDESLESKLVTLHMMPEHQRRRLFEDWSEVCTITDVVGLFKENNAAFYEMQRVLCGHAKTSVPKSERTFIIGPNPEFVPRADRSSEGHKFEAEIEIPRRRGVRQFMSFKVPQKTSADRAIQALLRYGKDSPDDFCRNALVEYTEDEFLDWQIEARKKAKEQEEASASEPLSSNKNKGRR